MFHTIIQAIRRDHRGTDGLMLALAVFTGSFFIYRDLGIRMLLGFGALCLLLLIHMLRRILTDRPPLIQPLHLPYLALSLVIMLNFLRPDSRHDMESLSYISSMAISCGFVLLAAPSPRECRRSLDALYWAGFFIAAFVAFFSVFEDLFWNSVFHILTPTAQDYLLFFVPAGYGVTLGGCTFSSYILFIGMAVCCGFLFSSPKWTKTSTRMLVSFCFFFLALVLVGRRGEMLGALVCTAILVLAMCKPRQRRLLIAGGAIALTAVCCLILAFLPELKQIGALRRYVETIESILAGQDFTSGRLTLYLLALDTFRAHPLLGIGWDQFHSLIPTDYLTDPVVGIEDVHCIYLQFLCETGIVSTIAILAPLLYFYYQACAQLRRLKHRKGESDTISLALNLCVCSFLLQSFLLFVGIYDPNFQRVIFWCFYSLSILLMTAALHLEQYHPTDPVSRMLERAAEHLRPAGAWIWRILRTPWKEGK